MTIEVLRKAMPHARQVDIEKHAAAFIEAMQTFQIITPVRQAMFIAQVAHESGSFKYTKELASGDAYDTRTDLGNTPEVDGDGAKWKGRGWLQLTGYSNYKLYSDYVKDPSILINPDKVSTDPVHINGSAAWFWAKFKFLNAIADHNTMEAFFKVSVKINGMNKKLGLPNHWDERKARWAEAKKALAL